MSLHDQTSFEDVEGVALTSAVSSNHIKFPRTGFVVGTRVETEHGWVPVERVRTGEKVHTFDGGLQLVMRVERTATNMDPRSAFHNGLMMVPGGALNNCDAFYLLPEQCVLLEGVFPEVLIGAASTLVPAAALEEYRGIARVMPVDVTGVVTLFFNDEEIVYANTGVMMHCASKESAGSVMQGKITSPFFEVLPETRARRLLNQVNEGTSSSCDTGKTAAFAIAA